MDKLTSILVVIDPADGSRHVVAKAMVLARHFRARLELFLCDPEDGHSLRHAHDKMSPEEAQSGRLSRLQRYVDAVGRSLAEDVPITTHVASEGPLCASVVHRVHEMCPDLVVKSAAGHHPMQRFSLDANDWQLAKACPVPLMLTRGRPWSARGRFAAAVDVADAAGSGLARSVMEAAGFLTLGCHGQLDVLYCEQEAKDSVAVEAHWETLGRLVRKFQVGVESQHVIAGAADDVLPGFADSQNYDLMIIGALTRRQGIGPLMGTLTSRLIDALACDFVLVKADSQVTPVVEWLHEVTA
ncbi:MAG: universal stress protein [Gammaproteobacteria bacterium]